MNTQADCPEKYWQTPASASRWNLMCSAGKGEMDAVPSPRWYLFSGQADPTAMSFDAEPWDATCEAEGTGTRPECSKLAPGGDLITCFPCVKGACCGCVRRRRRSPWPPFSAFSAVLRSYHVPPPCHVPALRYAGHSNPNPNPNPNRSPTQNLTLPLPLPLPPTRHAGHGARFCRLGPGGGKEVPPSLLPARGRHGKHLVS